MYKNVQIFIPCFIDQLFPDTAVNMVKLLRQAGCIVDYNPKQTCCGQPAFNAGFWAEAQKVSEKWIIDMAKLNQPIICPSASCVGYAKNSIQDFEFSNLALHKAYENIKIYEFSDFVVNHLGITDFKSNFPYSVTYHDACAALRECQIKEAPRLLLSEVQGLELIEMSAHQQCCGFGGTFATKFEPIAVAMGEKKVEAALQTGAKYIVSTDLSCLMHLQGYIEKKQLPIQSIHLIDVLAA